MLSIEAQVVAPVLYVWLLPYEPRPCAPLCASRLQVVAQEGDHDLDEAFLSTFHQGSSCLLAPRVHVWT